MSRIYKYEISWGRALIALPCGAQVRHFGMQEGVPFLWAEVDPTAPLETRFFILFGTGQDIPAGGVYHGTVHHGAYVWHLYEEGE